MENSCYDACMNPSPSASRDLSAAAEIAGAVRHRYSLSAWYPIVSSLFFVGGVGLMGLGVVAGWFLPVLGAALLTFNAASFSILVTAWRVRGVVPFTGRAKWVRYWRIMPVAMAAVLVLGFCAQAFGYDQRIWFMLAVVLPFTVEHVCRIRKWRQR